MSYGPRFVTRIFMYSRVDYLLDNSVCGSLCVCFRLLWHNNDDIGVAVVPVPPLARAELPADGGGFDPSGGRVGLQTHRTPYSRATTT